MSRKSDEESGIFIVQGIKVTFIGITDFSKEEAKNYVEYVKEKVPNARIVSITVKLCEDGMVDVDWTVRNEPFERIRRITGYLVGSIERWNNSKREEEKDRVKHDVDVEYES